MAFFFSRSTQECTQDVIKRMFGVQEIKHYEKYLGFHLWLGEAIKLALATLKKGCGRSYKVAKGNFVSSRKSVRTYVFLMLRTYVMILCNWLILWQNALYLYLGRLRKCLNTSRNHVSRSSVEAFKFVQEIKQIVQIH